MAWAMVGDWKLESRPTGDPVARHMRLAYEVASHSPDPSTQNGAVLFAGDVDSPGGFGRKIVSACNEVCDGVDVPAEVLERDREFKYQIVEHAERAVLYKAHQFSRSYPKIMVSPWAACCECARAIVLSGVRELWRHKEAMAVGEQDERWQESVALGNWLLECGGVKVQEWSGELGVEVRRDGRLVRL